MNKIFVIGVMSSTLFLGACDQFKNKNNGTVSKENAEWSCTSEDNIKDLQAFLKQEYLKQIDKQLRSSSDYEADQALLKKINDSLKFSIKEIRTITTDSKATSALECEGQIVVNFPKGLLKRAENAYLEHGYECEECAGEESVYRTLIDYLEAREVPLTIQDDLVKGKFYFDVIKTDKEGYGLTVQQQDDVISTVALITEKAVLYEAYVKENERNREYSAQSRVQHDEQVELAIKAMNIRKKELEDDKAKVVERLNLTWDNFSEEQRTQLKQDQSEWFEKRDIDCKVISQKNVYDMPESERETYQKQSSYWNDDLRAQNKDMQYNKCFIQRSNERIVYLNNVFN